MQLKSGQDMESHISEMLDTVDRLNGLGESLANHLQVAFLLGSLPDEYNSIITALEVRSDADLTLELVKEKLIQEFKRRQEAHQESGLSNLALKSKAKTTLKCFNCGKTGHFKRDCKIKKQVNTKQSQHNVKKTSEDSNSNEFCLNSSEKLCHDSWYIDSGASCHMSSNYEFFEKYDDSTNGDIYLANGKKTKPKEQVKDFCFAVAIN